VLGLQLIRGYSDLRSGSVCRLPLRPSADLPVIVAQSRTALWTDESLSERAMQLGKAQNLRRAARSLNGTFIPAGSIFSFWKQLGRATRRKGYVAGRELREGCLVPAVGGGICQLSNALYDVALQAGCEIVERHGHSRVVPGSAAAAGRDATVFWNYVDLRWRAPSDLLLETRLSSDYLYVTLRGTARQKVPVPNARPLSTNGSPPKTASGPEPASCMSCGMESCFRHPGAIALSNRESVSPGRTAYLLDEAWPELVKYVTNRATDNDVALVPRIERALPAGRHPWPFSKFEKVHEAPLRALGRSVAVRRLARQGAAGGKRRAEELRRTGHIAKSLMKRLPWNVTSLVVTQSFLPFLWLEGELGGRRYEVLMTRLPMRELHRRLDEALARFPDRASLGDFRADPHLVRAEWDALLGAERIITPHREIAQLFPGRAELLEWDKSRATNTGFRARERLSSRSIGFPGPTAARKGAYEVREVARQLDLEVLLCGSELERDGFWDGVRVRRVKFDDAIAETGLIVQPSFVEDQPRTLLKALSHGCTVIATPACGLPSQDRLIFTAAGEVGELEAAIQSHFLHPAAVPHPVIV